MVRGNSNVALVVTFEMLIGVNDLVNWDVCSVCDSIIFIVFITEIFDTFFGSENDTVKVSVVEHGLFVIQAELSIVIHVCDGVCVDWVWNFTFVPAAFICEH